MIKQKDLRIMHVLRENSRISLTRMSKRLGIPISTLYDKLKSYQQSVIKKHTCLLDFTQLGYNARAKVTLQVERADRNHLLEKLLKAPNVNSVYKISNGYDFLIDVIFKDVKELEDYFDILEEQFKIKNRQVYFVIEDLKQEAFLTEIEVYAPTEK